MSEKHVRRATVVMEKTILKEFLQMYKSFPCLWDQKHMLYANREARDNAYEALLEKYKLVHDNATVIDVKKKIEYMRCAYRREHKKVLMAQFRGGDYKPHLWYFNLLLFLSDNEQSEFKLSESMSSNNNFEDSYQEPHEVDDSDDDQSSKPKRRKRGANNVSSNPIYIEDHHNDEEEVAIQESLFDNDLEQDQQPSYIISNEADAFGRTVGYQLKGLTSIQRVFAEKLISDVIFHARLGNLNTETRLSYTRDD